MSKNPLVNAVAAALYIAIVASVIFYGGRLVKPEDTVLGPISFISLFTLSAAVMGYLFVYQPAGLYLDGDKKGALKLFLTTTVCFGVITFLFFLTLVLL